MYLEEKLKAEIVLEALEKSGEAISQRGDGQEARSETRVFVLPAKRFASASPAIATSVSSMLRTLRWLLG